ncbi:hypothetical protein [Sphingomonas sp. Leaf17]|uniref:hypothetical protein n=1 Tax=Sphingomonas sp. Leaf17 TaxID=1735683 RepID=UPI000B1E3BC5|nr:hypothetical protein [Sphingomonas sp. Leaf17]
MTAPHIHARYRTVPATMLLGSMGRSLERIKAEDELIDADLGRVIGKSADRIAAYRGGRDMSALGFVLACKEWDGRFANDTLALVGMSLRPLDGAAAITAERDCLPAVASAVASLAAALADGRIDDLELAGMTAELDAAAVALDALRERARGRRLSLISG